MAPHNFKKVLWGEGPWQNEPDEADWIDEATKLRCRVIRNSELGNLCGYCGVPPTHPAYELHYNGVTSLDAEEHTAAFRKALRKHHGKVGLPEFNELPKTEIVPGIGEMILKVQVHGGLTFAGRFKEDDVWWLGFDCAHVGDLCPGLEHMRRHLNIKSPFEELRHLIPKDKYCTLKYVKAECTSLTRQLHEMDVKSRMTLGGLNDNTTR